MKQSSHQQSGFTLIEMIVSLALFSTVIVISIGALLVLVATNEQLQGEQSVMTNLSFALDSMSREIRTGTSYYCDWSANNNNNIFNNSVDLDNPVPSSPSDDGLDSDDTGDCFDGIPNPGVRFQGVAFIEGGESITETGGRILYYYSANDQKIYRRVGDQSAQSIISDGILITDAEFFVTGSEPLSADPSETDQPSVTIIIKAQEDGDTSKTYELQTTVTQRILDI